MQPTEDRFFCPQATSNTKDRIYSYKLLLVYWHRSAVGKLFCPLPIYINKQHDAKHQRELATVDWNVQLPSWLWLQLCLTGLCCLLRWCRLRCRVVRAFTLSVWNETCQWKRTDWS